VDILVRLNVPKPEVNYCGKQSETGGDLGIAMQVFGLSDTMILPQYARELSINNHTQGG
jgi:hypothetical protein